MDLSRHGIVDDSVPATVLPSEQAPIPFDDPPADFAGGNFMPDNLPMGLESPEPVEPAVEPAPAPAPGQSQTPAPQPGPVLFTPEQMQEILRREREAYMPLVELVRNDPEVANFITQKISGPKEPELVAPTRPVNFNMADLANPESESSKYFVAQQDYTMKRQEMLEKKLEAANQRQQEYIKQQQAQEQARIQMQQAESFVQQKYGLSPQEAHTFVETYSKPDSVNMDNLVALFRMQQGATPQSRPQQTRPLPGRSVPPPGGPAIQAPMVTTIGGVPIATREESMSFTNGLKATVKRGL